MNRREFIKRSALIGAGTAAASLLNACAPAATATQAPAATAAKAVFDWKRFKGEKIEALLIKNTVGDLLVKYQKEFEDLTGITVGADTPAEQQQRQKLAVEFQSGQTSFDVVYYSFHVQKRLFGKNKWVADVREYLNDPTMVAPDWDWNDFSAAGKAWSTEADGRIDAVCNKIDYFILYCNK
ncbi:MAG: sugar ABC transporter substrate-binding protein, partial [Chloroflexota bacterium]